MIFDTSEDIKRTVRSKTNAVRESTVQDNIDDDILKKLEAIRRS